MKTDKTDKSKIEFQKWLDASGCWLPVTPTSKTPMDFEAIELIIESHVLVAESPEEFAPYDLMMAWNPSEGAFGRKGGSIFLGYFNQ